MKINNLKEVIHFLGIHFFEFVLVQQLVQAVGVTFVPAPVTRIAFAQGSGNARTEDGILTVVTMVVVMAPAVTPILPIPVIRILVHHVLNG